MRKLNILLVGLGGMGKVHLANIERLNNAKVVATVGKGERDEEVAKAYNLPFFGSIKEAIESLKEINLVDITTPTFLHKENVLEALSLSLDVLVEKPIALSSEDAKELFSKAREKGVSLNVAHVMRYTHEFKALKKLVEEKKYGRVMDASFTRLSEKPKWVMGSWLFDKKKSGLIPFDLHIHDLDMIVSLFGLPNRFFSYSSKPSDSDIDLYYHMDYSFCGFVVRAESGWLEASIPFTASWRVIFESAVVIYDGKNVTVYPKDGKPLSLDTHYDVVVSTGINVPATGWYYEELKTIFSKLSERSTDLIDEREIIEELEILEKL